MIVAASTLGSCYDSFEGSSNLDGSDAPLANITIERLCAMLESDMLLIYDDMVVRGSVTSTDRNGNFYKTFVIEEDGYGLEIMEGLYDSYARHDVGSVVSVKLQGLALSTYRGVHQVGVESVEGSYYTLDYLSAEAVIDQHIFNTYTYAEVEPYVVNFEDLSEAMCGRLVCLESLIHVPTEGDTQPYTWGSYQQFVDNSGNSIWVYTSDYANFSLLEIPQQSVALSGILQYGSISGVSGDQYMLEMRGVDDCVYESISE
ncbi:MAG: DUF5689 domain-containing protein [Rikenellaceae bacterium]